MKTLCRLSIALALVCALALGGSFAFGQTQTPSADQTGKINALIDSYVSAYKAKNLNALKALLNSESNKILKADFEVSLKRIFDTDMANASFEAVQPTIGKIQPVDNQIAVHLTLKETVKAADGALSERARRRILLLREQDGRMGIDGSVEEVVGKQFNPETRVCTSENGQFTVTAPEQWISAVPGVALAGISADSVCLIAPDVESYVVIGFIKLPINLSPKQAVEADAAALQRLSKSYVAKEEGEIQVAGMNGYRKVSEFVLSEDSGMGARQREQIYFGKDRMLYFFLFEAEPPSQYAVFKPALDATIKSFTLLSAPEGTSPQEQVTEKLSKGSVTGQTYTNDEFNCFIAAPAGWTLDTSPNPAHLCQMNRKTGNSLVRLIASRIQVAEIPTTEKAFTARLEQMKTLVQNFKEISRRDLTVGGAPAIESIQSYKIDGVGQIEVKELTVIRDGVYYLVLCQAIEPDTLQPLGPDFDQIILSFGFMK